MISEFGECGLWTALIISLTKVCLQYFVGRYPPIMQWRGQQVAAFSEFFCISLSFSCLMAAYILSDFSLKNVVENSHSSLSLLYRISGTWSNHEGSMMLWLWILSLYGAVMAWVSDDKEYLPLHISARIYHGLLVASFCGYILNTSNPFLLTNEWLTQGHELNPLLQDPALAIHPPLLYLGYVGFAVPFCYALAGSSRARNLLGHQWLCYVRRWSLWAWSFLTLGIALGSFWAYYELGWGGYWFWDPVETASLLPWLSGAALVHITQLNNTINQNRVLLKTCWLLAVFSFIMALLGTYLVRSGVLSTVHAFAQSAERGDYLLMILVSTVLVATLNALKNYKYFAGPRLEFKITKQTLIVILAYLIFVLIIVALLGTLYPLILEKFGGAAVSVGTPYFERTFVPISLLLVVLMGFAGFMYQSSMTLAVLIKRFHWNISILLLGIIVPIIVDVSNLLAFYGLELSLWMLTMTVLSCWHSSNSFITKLLSGMTLAHLGCGLMIMGMATDRLYHQENIVALKIGDEITFAGHHLRLHKIDYQREATYMTEAATLQIAPMNDQPQHNRYDQAVTIYPEKRFYTSYQSLIAKTALYAHNFSYLYVVLGGVLPDQRWTVRLYYHPQIMWIWLGAAIMAIGMLRSWMQLNKGKSQK